VTHSQQERLFIDWVRQYDAVLWRIARTYAPWGEHLDLHQDLLIALWHALPLYRDQASPSTFLYRVGLNCALNWVRERTRYRARHTDLTKVHTREQPPGESDRVKQLYAALNRMSEADRTLALLYLDDLSYREIGEILGLTETNVGAKLTRLRRRLTDELNKEPHQ